MALKESNKTRRTEYKKRLAYIESKAFTEEQLVSTLNWIGVMLIAIFIIGII